jgi:hypothetical protein
MCINQSNDGKRKITISAAAATTTQKKLGHQQHFTNCGMNIIPTSTTTHLSHVTYTKRIRAVAKQPIPTNKQVGNQNEIL